MFGSLVLLSTSRRGEKIRNDNSLLYFFHLPQSASSTSRCGEREREKDRECGRDTHARERKSWCERKKEGDSSHDGINSPLCS